MGFLNVKMLAALGWLMLALTLEFQAKKLSFSYSDNQSQDIIIPFQLIKKLIVVNAFVNGEEGKFIIDTGVKSLVLNRKYFHSRSSSSFSGKDFAGFGMRLGESLVKFGWDYKSQKNHYTLITELKNVEDIMGMKIMGYIGYEILQNYEVVFDYQKREMALFSLDRKGKRRNAAIHHNQPTDTILLKQNDYLPYLTINLDGKKLKLGIDSGASRNLLRTQTREKIDTCFQSSGQAYTAGFNGKKALTESGKITKVKINDLPLKPMTCVVTDMKHLNLTLGTRLDGLLGFEFLSQYKMAINYQRNEMYVWAKN